MHRRNGLWSIVVGGVVGTLLWAGPVGAQSFPGGLPACQAELNTCTTSLGTCQVDLAACQAEPVGIFPGDGYGSPDAFGVSGHGPALSYTDNGDGTFTDNNTLLMWEKKDPVGTGGIHDVNNVFLWSRTGSAADGTLFTFFLATLNGVFTSPCFAGHCDWRIPNVKELQSIVDYSKTGPATSVPGSTNGSTSTAGEYWSSSTAVDFPFAAWTVGFGSGDVTRFGKAGSFQPVRAVRGGR